MLSVVAIALTSASAFAPPAGLARVGGVNAQITMNAANNPNVKENVKNGNKGLYGWQVKKNPKTGDTANLRGYTVGSRAPPMSISSGTTIAATGFRYKGAAAKSIYSRPTAAGDSGIDLRQDGSSGRSGDLFTHSGVWHSQGDKDCFINRAKLGPIAATNEIFIHSGVWHSQAEKDTLLKRLSK